LSVIIIGTTAVYGQDSFEILYKEKNPSFLQMDIGNYTELSKLGIKKISFDNEQDYLNYLDELKSNENIVFAEENIKFFPQIIPNDPYLGEDAVGNFYEDEWGLGYIKADQAWEIETGSSDVTVAVIDSGFVLNDLDLVNRYVQGYDFVNNDTNPSYDDGAYDEISHGMIVAKIIAAEGNNGIEKAGVTWNSKIMPLMVFDIDNTTGGEKSTSGSAETVASAIIYAADNGAHIINLSLGSEEYSRTVHEAVKYAYDLGCTIVAAAGNNGGNVMYPAALKEVMAVGAVDINGNLKNYSAYGPELSLTAPGAVVEKYNGYTPSYAHGTSFAAPYVSGAAALLKSHNPNLTNQNIQWILERSADDLGSPKFDSIYGYGSLNIYRALTEDIKYFKNVEYKRVMDIFLDQMSNMEWSEVNALGFYFEGEDVPGADFGIYALQNDLPELLSTAQLDRLVELGVGATRQEAMVKLQESLVEFLDWTILERLHLLDLILGLDETGITKTWYGYDYRTQRKQLRSQLSTSFEEAVKNLLIEKKTYNPYIDNNNSSDTAYLTENDISDIIGMPLDKDYFKVSPGFIHRVALETVQSTDIKITTYNKDMTEQNGTNTFSSETIVKVESLSGRWHENGYIVNYRLIPFGEFNGDNMVDIYDLVLIARNLEKSASGLPFSDVDGNGTIDIVDLAAAAQNYGIKY